MRVASIGGGPGGLFLAALMKKADPSHEVVVYERNAPDATFGFGVVLSDRTLGNLESADPRTYRALTEAAARWTDIEVRHKGRALRCGGNGFSAISRKQLLLILQERIRELGVDLRFESEVPEPASLADYYDLVVAADGINSRTREAYAERFGPQVSVGAAKYAWFGTPQQFDALTFIFVENEHGRFSVHAYPSDGETSTFIVETDEETWRRAGLDATDAASLAPGESDERAKAYCEEVFADHLGGHGLLTNNSKWLNFRTVRNERWCHGNTVLIGDAAHTAHFSVGSGTKMAMEDAIALAEAVAKLGAAPEALTEYEKRRRPAVERIQAAARPSQMWWESFGRHMRLEPEQFAYHFLTRNPRLTHEGLKVRDYRFVRKVESWFARQTSPEPDGRGSRSPSPLKTPLSLRGITLPNRIGVAYAADPAGSGRARYEDRLARVAGAAVWGAGLISVSAGELRDDADAAEWLRVSGYVHHHTFAKLALLASGDAEEPETTARRAAEAGFDALELPDHDGVLGRELLLAAEAGGRARSVLDALSRVREVWPGEKPIVVHLSAPGEADLRRVGESVVEFSRTLGARGCDIVAVSVGPGSGDVTDRQRVAQLETCDRIRIEAAVATMLVGGVLGDEEATTAILSGRADLCRGRPSLAGPLWRRDEAPERTPTGVAPLAVAGEGGGEAPS